LTFELDGGEWSASCPSHFTLGERALGTPLDKRLGGPQSHSGGGEEKHSQPLPGIKP